MKPTNNDQAIAKEIGDAVKALNDLARKAADAGINVKFDTADFPLALTMNQRGDRNKLEVHVSKDLPIE